MYPPHRKTIEKTEREKKKKNPEMSRNRDAGLALVLSRSFCCSFIKNVFAGRAPLEAEITWLAVLKWDHVNLWREEQHILPLPNEKLNSYAIKQTLAPLSTVRGCHSLT